MSEHSPIQGKTPQQATRAIDADWRRQDRAKRTDEEQLAELDKRPGESTRERKRLTA